MRQLQRSLPVAAMSICLFLSASPAAAQTCGIPALTGNFAVPPCSLPQPTQEPGTQFKPYMQSWWDGQFLPRLKEMTKELYAYRIWQTFDLGHLMDAQNINRAARVEQEQRVTAQQGVLTSDQVCIAGTSTVAITKTALNATALTQGFKKDLLRRSHNAVQEPVNGSYTPPGITPATDSKARWEEFCQEFHDQDSNGGKGVCAGKQNGPAKNNDVSVEGFLLRDTINLNDPHEYKSARAILVNIVEPIIYENLTTGEAAGGGTDGVLGTVTGKENILRRQHIEAIRNIAADVVASIISRRAPLSQTDAEMAKHILEIREQAGVPACPEDSDPPKPINGACYSKTPSYNEIMLALTKERFFSPGYFTSMETNPGAIQQEQAAIDGYTTVQLQDIYRVQEQINALLAARASLKLSTDQLGNQSSAAPN